MTPIEVRRKLDKSLFHFIAGPAGSGKTYLIRQIKEADPYNCFLTATTGIDAVQLSNEATTINSLLGGYYNVEALAADLGSVASALKWRSYK